MKTQEEKQLLKKMKKSAVKFNNKVVRAVGVNVNPKVQHHASFSI